MKKQAFLINCKKNDTQFFEEVNGYTETLTDSNGNTFSIGYNFYRERREWIATELITGYRCSNHSVTTKEDVINFVHANIDKIATLINGVYHSPKHAPLIQAFRDEANKRNLNQPCK